MTTGKEFVSSVVVRGLTTKPLLWLGSKVFHEYVPIFMLHRFSCPALGIRGHETSFLRWALEYLRKRKFNFVSVEEVATAISNGVSLPPRSISFSLDDGFWDQAEVGAPILSAYDCPATFFVTTGFIDHHDWLWDVKVEYAFSECGDALFQRYCESIPGNKLGIADRQSCITRLLAELKTGTIEDINSRVSSLFEVLEVDMPEHIPDRHRPVSWEGLAQLQNMGMHIGPHTYRHPILANETSEVAQQEISRSMADLSRRLGEYSNIFCYPVGRKQDFGEREKSIVKELGFAGAVSAIPGATDLKAKHQLFAMPRFGFPDTEKNMIQYASWIETFKSKVRWA